MTGFILRIIAMSTMLLDHIGWNFIDNPMLLTWLWRIAFPIYAFLIAESFFFVFKEKRRYLKYLSMLIILAIIAEPCYDLLEFWKNITTNFMESQSVIITLLLWFLWITLTESLIPYGSKIKIKDIVVLSCTYLLIAFTNYKMWANFNMVWPLLVIAFYWYIRYARNTDKTANKRSWWKRFLTLLWIFAIYLTIYFRVRSNFWSLSQWLEQIQNYYPWIIWHVLAALILSFSNWKLWYHEKRFKWFYVSFYPLHALIIWIIISLI